MGCVALSILVMFLFFCSRIFSLKMYEASSMATKFSLLSTCYLLLPDMVYSQISLSPMVHGGTYHRALC